MSNKFEEHIRKSSTQKEKILHNLREALLEQSQCKFQNIDVRSSVFEQNKRDIAVKFAENFKNAGGIFTYVETMDELLSSIKKQSQLEDWESVFVAEDTIKQFFKAADIDFSDNPEEAIICKITATSCLSLIAKTGSIIVSNLSTLAASLAVADTHIIVATTAQILEELHDFFTIIPQSFPETIPTSFSIITGTSIIRDADGSDETTGVGLKKIELFLLEQ
jgi:L-lactate dehydrogenase complex protein LldG